MENFTIMDGVVVTIISILVVFLVLIGLQIAMVISRMVIERQKKNQSVKGTGETDLIGQQNNPARGATDLKEDEETKIIAALMALILANQDEQDKQYQITSIKRVR